MPVGVAGSSDQHRGVADPPALTDLHRQRIDPHKQIRAGVQGPAAPGRHQFVQLAADPRHLRLGDPLQAHRAGQVIDPPGRPPFHITLHHHRGQRPLGPPARLQQRREVAALPQLGDRQLNRPDPGVPVPWPIPIAVGHPLGLRWPCSAPIWADTSTSINAWARVRTPRAGSRHRPPRPCAATHTAPSWTRPPCSSSTWILRAFASRMTRWSSRHHLVCTQRGGARMLAQLLASSAVARASTPLPGTLMVPVGPGA